MRRLMRSWIGGGVEKRLAKTWPEIDRKSVVWGKRVDLGGRRIIKKKTGRLAAGTRLRAEHAIAGQYGVSRVKVSHAIKARPDYFFFSSRRRHTRLQGDWSSDVCSSD